MGPQHSDLLVTLKHFHPSKCLLHRSTHSKLNTCLLWMLLAQHVLSGWSGHNGQHWDSIVSAGPSPDTLTSFHYLHVIHRCLSTWDQQRGKQPLREVNNISTVTQGFCRLSVSISQKLISLSVHHVRWGWLRTQNEGCWSCIAMLCGHNPLTKRGNLSLHGSLEMPETAVMVQHDWTEHKPSGLCSMLCQRQRHIIPNYLQFINLRFGCTDQ